MTNPIQTAERGVSRPRDEIVKEAARIEEAALYSSKGHFKAAEMWGWFHVILGLLIVALAAVAGAKAFSKIDADGTMAGVLSIAVAVLSAVATFLNPNRRASDHLSAGNKYDALISKARIFRTIECWGDMPDQVLSDQLKRYSAEKASLNTASPQISFIAYRLAKAGIQRGEGVYAADANPEDRKPGSDGAEPPAAPPATR